MLWWSVSSSRVCSPSPSVPCSDCGSVGEAPPPVFHHSRCLDPIWATLPRQSAPFISPSHRSVYSVPPHGRVGRSCRQMERLVLVPDGAQRKRAHVCLVGPIQTLLQPSGIAAVGRGGGVFFKMVVKSFCVCFWLRLLQTVSKIFYGRSTMTPSTWWPGSTRWVSSSVRP